VRVGARHKVPRCAVRGLQPDLTRPVQLRGVRVQRPFPFQ
jgi:hypothetical protein